MDKVTVPPLVWAAMARLGFAPDRLALYQVTDLEVILCVEGLGEVRVEISSLPAGLVDRHFAEPVPETAVAQEPAEPEHA